MAPTVISITTLAPEVPEDGGVVLKGKLEGAEHVQSHGFVYSTDSTFAGYETRFVFFEKPAKDGAFEAEVNTNLGSGRLYFYQAFVESAGKNISGEVKTFIPNGSKAPVITAVVPEKGHLEDTIKIYGQYFGGYTKAFFDNKSATIIEKNDSIITCLVPPELERITSDIIVRSGEKRTWMYKAFSLYEPEIHSISKQQGTFRDVIEINGNHFDISESRTKVWLNEVEAKVAGVSRKRIIAVVPDLLQLSMNEIKVSTQKHEILSPDRFEIVPPSISQIPTTVKSGELVTIEGENFHPIASRNKVFFGEAQAEVQSGGSNSLTVKVPKGPYPLKENHVKVQIVDIEGISAGKFSFSDTWRMISDKLPFSYYRSTGSFVLDNIAYVIAPSTDYSDNEVFLWVFNASDYSWTKREIPVELSSGSIAFGNGSTAYLYTATEASNFYEYNPTTNSWSAKPDFPGAKRASPVSFALSTGAYIGLGIDYSSWETINFTDFYHFNAASNSWTRKNDFEGEDREYFYRSLKEASVFVLNDEAYIGGGGGDTGKTEFWKYNAAQDSWQERARFHEAHYGNPTFVLNGKGYIANGITGGGCWEYNPVVNAWMLKPGPDNYASNTGSFAFVVNGIPFLGGGERRINEFYMLNVTSF